MKSLRPFSYELYQFSVPHKEQRNAAIPRMEKRSFPEIFLSGFCEIFDNPMFN